MRYLFILLFLSPLVLQAQRTCTTAPVETYIVLAKEGERSVKQTKNILQVKMVGDFDDSCLLYINDRLIFGYFVSTNPLLGETGYSISVNKKKAKPGALLKMMMWNKRICFSGKINFKYPILEIRYFENKYILTYTNRVAELE